MHTYLNCPWYVPHFVHIKVIKLKQANHNHSKFRSLAISGVRTYKADMVAILIRSSREDVISHHTYSMCAL